MNWKQALVATVLLAAQGYHPAAANPLSCSVIDGKFRHVWGGEVHQSYVLDANSNLAWTVEDGGRMRRTLDGATWTFLNTPTCVQQRLRGVYFLASSGGRTGWAVGNDGTFMRTLDGGLNWTVMLQMFDANHKPAELWDVRFHDINHGWVAGNHLLRYTIDGGVNWYNVAASHPFNANFDLTTLEFYALDFTFLPGGSYIGLAVAEPGFILRTDSSSSGQIWSVVYEAGNANYPAICAPCAGSAPFEPWDVEFVPGATSASTAVAIVAGGFGLQCGIHLSSLDGGLQWKQEHAQHDSCNNSVVAGCAPVTTALTSTLYGTTTFVDRTALTVGYGGGIYLRDGTNCTPAIWRLQPQIQQGAKVFSQPLRGVDSNGAGAGTGVAYVTGLMNGLYKTTSGGTNPHGWQVQSTGNDVFRISGIHFLDGSNGWAVGQGYRIDKTADGGVNWTDLSYSATASGRLAEITTSPNASNGVAVGHDFGTPRALKIFYQVTSSTWSDTVTISGTLPAGPTGLTDVAWTQAAQFWAVGDSGLVLRSNNGGLSWTVIPIRIGGSVVSDISITGVSFLNANDGFVVGQSTSASSPNARIYRVTNATSANPVWTNVSPPSTLKVTVLTGVAATGTRAFAVGRKGVVPNESRVVLKWTGSGFVEEITPVVPRCEETDSLAPGTPETRWSTVSLSPTTNEVFVGGSCGRFLRYDGTSWSELRSLTSFHIGSSSFYSATGGFFLANAGSHAVIMKYTP